jgi:tetratricopeptide (TPR) repeat protein
MKIHQRFPVLLILLACIFLITQNGPRPWPARAQTYALIPLAVREDAYRANNLGVALMEQFKYKEAAEQFTRALQLDQKFALARINLSLALFNVPDLQGAQREAEKAIAQAPNAPQPHYIIGLIAKTQNRPEDGIAAFQRVLKIDPNDVGANINLGQLLSQQRKYAEALAAFRTALSVEPYNSTAIYNLATTLMRTNQRDEGQRMIQRFQELRQRGSGTVIGTNYLEQGRYAEAIASTGAEAELVERATPAVTYADGTASMLPQVDNATGATSGATSSNAASSNIESSPIIGRRFRSSEFTDATKRLIVNSLGGNVTLFDYDGDNDLDMLAVTPLEQRLYRNDGGKFTDITAQSGALSIRIGGTGAVAGDYDNDGKPDLFIIRSGSLALYHNDGGGKFSDVTRAAGLPDYPYLSAATAFVDVDHDGDLDIFVAGLADLSKAPTSNRESIIFPGDFAGAPNLLLRNDGNGKFTDITVLARVNIVGHALAVVPTDYNNTRDVDLLVLNYGAVQNLFSNQRDGTFKDVAREAGVSLEGRWTGAAAGDVNKDGFTDFFFGRANGPGLFAISDGKGKFKTSFAPAETEGATSAQFLDYDNDGLLDCLMLVNGGLRVLRNVGDGWANTSERAVTGNLFNGPATQKAQTSSPARLFAAGDLDLDGDTDIISLDASGELHVARNDGGNNNRSLRVNLTGRVSNKSGVGAKIEARAGSLVQKLESYAASPAPAPADIIFGLGQRSSADCVRVLWPAGIVQAETEIPAPNSSASVRAGEPKKIGPAMLTLPITELDRKPSSCPYLYTWNGERFEFVTDFMGGGEMGYLEEPGRYNTPDPSEYVRIRGDQLRERDGRYDLRVTNELEESMFVDRLQLIAVAHPASVAVYPNEGMSDPPRPFILYRTQGARPPLAATDDHGHDVLSRVSQMDRQYPDDFRLDQIRGYGDEHTLTLKLAREQKDKGGRVLLLLTGWTDYSWSSDNVAAAQAGREMRVPALQVKDAQGEWRTVIDDIGIPVGRPQTVTVDLTGKFLTGNREVRIVTSMRIYWDQIQVDTSKGDFPVRLTRLDPVSASLRWRGYSREVSPDGREPYGYDYERVSNTSPWKVMAGRYTREGDVRELLLKTDDMFVVSRTGDELSLSFDARMLPALPAGWTRTFLLYADGFSKEMDINSASPDGLSPFPFHGMKRYPYSAPEAYPLTEERRAYMLKYNTRVVTSQVPSIDSTLRAVTSDK